MQVLTAVSVLVSIYRDLAAVGRSRLCRAVDRYTSIRTDRPGMLRNVCLPNEFEVGVGVLDDRIPGSPAVFLLGLSFISSEWPLDFVFEGDFGATVKDAPECRLYQETPNCFDASLL